MASDQVSGMERRRHPRTRLSRQIQGIRLDPDGGDMVEQMDTLDVSRSGMGALCSRSFYPGQRVVLRMPRVAESGERSIYATIVRCRPRSQRYQVGMEFDTTSLDSHANVVEAIVAA
jgi:hypothetical protein